MKELIQWLRKMEHLSCEVYSQAATTYADMPKLSKFLKQLAEEENRHYHIMESAAAFIESEPSIFSAVSIDEEVNDKILNHLKKIKAGVDQKSISKQRLIKLIAAVELSEWNDIFIYVVNTLKEKTTEFNFPAATMQAHIKGVVYYLETVEKQSEAIKKINDLPPVWTEKILVVDDAPAIAELVKNLLNHEGDIDIAHDGEAALELVEKNYYKLIISDVDMPVMNGLTLFEKAVSKHPTIKSRFLFMTGGASSNRDCFFNEHHVRCLGKPFGIKELRKEAYSILLSNKAVLALGQLDRD